jgi:hypothetical protein
LPEIRFNNLLKEVNQMVTCFGCGGSIDVFDRYCRWCGRTFIPDNYGPLPPRPIDSPAFESMQPRCGTGVDGCTDYMECNNIGLVLTRGIFHDDEEELNDVMDLISVHDPPSNANQGY